MMAYLLAHPTCFAIVALCGVSDRLVGWGGLGRTKPMILIVLALAGWAWWAVGGLYDAITLPVAFLVWRTPGWGFFGGSINPAPGKAIYTFFRHSLAFAFVVPAYLAGLHLLPVSLAILAFAMAATVLAVINYFTLATLNWLIEFIRGCCLGAALGAGFVLFQ